MLNYIVVSRANLTLAYVHELVQPQNASGMLNAISDVEERAGEWSEREDTNFFSGISRQQLIYFVIGIVIIFLALVILVIRRIRSQN